MIGARLPTRRKWHVHRSWSGTSAPHHHIFCGLFFCSANQTDVLAQFGRCTTRDLMATTHSAFIIDPPNFSAAAPTPEPATLLLLLSMLGLAVFRLRRKSHA